MGDVKIFSMQCPAPVEGSEIVLLAHGGGGRLMHQLIERYVIPAFDNDQLTARHDGAVFDVKQGRMAFTTDSYVVSPLFFPGGDIGSLAVNGTVNDLAMCGARPLYLSAAFIVEEGLPCETLERVIASMQRAAEAAGVKIVTGDTKVVDRGKCDKLFVNTAGVGVIEHGQVIAPASISTGDAILLSGDVGRHGVAVMATREGLEFASVIESDCAGLSAPVLGLIDGGVELHCLRDLTRGGVATSLVEIAETSRLGIHVREQQIAIEEGVRGACEVLGLDPLYLANEGRFVAFVAERDAERALDTLRSHSVSGSAQRIGTVTETPAGLVMLETVLGTTRVLDMERGEPLPRIC
jgi:hydrogenase expression/formation protein HypE